MGYSFIRNLIVLFLCALFSRISTGCYAPSAVQENVVDSNLFVSYPHRWIEQDKMRAGYLYYYNPVSKINLVKKLGLNTIIVKCWRFNSAKDKSETISSIRKWAKAAKDNDIHLFVAINWQPFPYMDILNYKKVVYEDGTEGVAVCPLDGLFGKDYISSISLLIAHLSIEPDIKIDGMFLDMEIYGSEKEPQVKKNYYEKRCGFSDVCFSQYLIYKGYDSSQFPLVDGKDRKKWLEKENLLDDYFVFLRKQIKKMSEDLRDSIHNVNPDFLIGMYPHPAKNNWVQYPLAEGFNSDRLPLIVFGTHSYGYYKDKNGDGYTFIPKDIKQQYKEDGINSLYSAGYLFRKYDGKTLERNLKQSVKNWDGYWLFNLPQLWKEKSKPDDLMDSAENLTKSVAAVNGA